MTHSLMGLWGESIIKTPAYMLISALFIFPSFSDVLFLPISLPSPVFEPICSKHSVLTDASVYVLQLKSAPCSGWTPEWSARRAGHPAAR